MGLWAEIGSSVLLYFLVFGMSATVDIRQLCKQLRNRNALLTGISLQFIILPFLGFVVVKILNLNAPMGITLLVVTSSPGGSYSNWWCSIFNADLALSVTMTTISTLLSVIFLPVNLILYATTSFSNDVVKSLDWTALFVSLIVVIGGIGSGILCSAVIKSPKFNLLANKLGNIAGVALITFSVVLSSTGGSGGHSVALWSQPAVFYIGVAAPCLIGLLVATWMVSFFRLAKPERVAVAVECCYQNTGIATSVAAAVFTGDDLAVAVGVPLFYGLCEAFFLAIYCITCWKIGWTKAPADANFCTVISTSYEVKEMMEEDPESIEVVLGSPGGDGELTPDLIFSTTKEGYQIDEVSLESLGNVENKSRTYSQSEFSIEDDDGDLEEVHVQLDNMDNVAEIDDDRTTSSSGRSRTKGQYETIELESPQVRRPISPKPLDSAPDIPSGGAAKLKKAGANLLSMARGRGKKKYSKAVAVEELVEEDEPDGIIRNVPASGKSID